MGFLPRHGKAYRAVPCTTSMIENPSATTVHTRATIHIAVRVHAMTYKCEPS